MITKADAITSLVPSCAFSIAVDGVVTWIKPDTSPLTDEQIEAELTRLQADYEAKQYQRQRATAYPPITDYLDGIVKGDAAQVQAYIDACMAVKQEFPK